MKIFSEGKLKNVFTAFLPACGSLPVLAALLVSFVVPVVVLLVLAGRV
ncbi:MAG: hypothetical protein IKA79_02880 [Lentisphaeria bacterium]|nr:hypothetical protein [Lentisphaeria bacterium]